MKFGLKEDIISKLTEVFEANPKVDKALIFGSRAKGNYRRDSDIDIAIKGAAITLDDILKMQVQFEEKGVKFKIDLLYYNGIKEKTVIEHIDRVGIDIYVRYKEYKLGEVLAKKGYIRGPFGSSLKRDEMKNSGIPVYEQKNAIYNSRDFRFFIDEQKFEELKRFQVQTNDLIISCSGTVGKVSIIRENDPKGIISQALLILRPDITKINLKYLYYFLSSKQGFELITQASHGSVQVNISEKKVVESIRIKIPPIAEQAIIAETLTSIDNKIDLLQRQNRTLEELAESVFRQWFLEEAGKNWKEMALDKIAEFLNGLACQKFPIQQNEEGLPVIKIKEMKNGITESSDIASSNVPEKYIVKDGDLLFSWSGSLDVGLWFGGIGVLNQHLFKVTSREFPQWFCYFWIKYHLEEFKGIAEDKSTTMGHIQRHHLSQARVLVPDKEGLKQMDEAINPFFKKLKSNQGQIGNLKQLRDTLLPKLINGEVRIEF